MIAARICVIGCAAECPHGQLCVIGSFGGITEAHPLTSGGVEAHLADDGKQMHEWSGKSRRCRVRPFDLDEDAADGPLTITLSVQPLDASP